MFLQCFFKHWIGTTNYPTLANKLAHLLPSILVCSKYPETITLLLWSRPYIQSSLTFANRFRISTWYVQSLELSVPNRQHPYIMLISPFPLHLAVVFNVIHDLCLKDRGCFFKLRPNTQNFCSRQTSFLPLSGTIAKTYVTLGCSSTKHLTLNFWGFSKPYFLFTSILGCRN